MPIRVKTSQKYYCIEPERLVRIAEQNGFKLVSKINEIDEYFTDIDGIFIKNRTCLRIRKNNDKKMIITFKGKSESLIGQYCKLENNIIVNSSEYDNYINLFASLGYYSYVEVNKNRIVYKLESGNYIYSIMLDNLNKIGGFIDFEVSTIKNDISKENLTKELSNLIQKFSSIKLNEATDTYLTIVAKHEKEQFDKKINDMYINIDCEIAEYEKSFYKNYKNKISKLCNANIKWGEYKKNSKIDEKIAPLVEEYLDNLIFDNNQLLVTMKLLKQLNYQKHFVTKVNKEFYTQIFKKIDIKLEDVIFIKNDNYSKILKTSCNNIRNSIFINEKNIKKINSILLIILNN